MIKTVLNIPIIQITYNSQEKLLYLEWKREPSIEEYQRAMIECLEFGRVYKVDNLLSDIRKEKHINPDNRKWFESQILPSVVKDIELKRAGVIHDGSWAQQKYLQHIIKNASKYNLQIKLFRSSDSALRWIKKSKFNLKEFFFG
jgi:hypothetical protein